MTEPIRDKAAQGVRHARPSSEQLKSRVHGSPKTDQSQESQTTKALPTWMTEQIFSFTALRVTVTELLKQ